MSRINVELAEAINRSEHLCISVSPATDYYLEDDEDGREALWVGGSDEPIAVNHTSMSWDSLSY